ncbi:CoA transferase [Nocardia ninae]|uniref:Carnitine dehydratase n=1 Tax=Nocardia ninae NBRC 108245 TaxID=1210091 RepID=A0A511MH16_9NOCA|nr:CoA transferase [Nocardia ninae]GEM39954.1 carnitine dehydratase [Nocardia ninae NBRC 108245]
MSSTEILDSLYELLGIRAEETGGKVTITGADPVTPSVHRIGDAAAAAYAAMGTEVAALWRQRSGQGQDVTVDTAAAAHSLIEPGFIRQADRPVIELLEDPRMLNTCTFYKARDGRYIYLMQEMPHLRDITLEVLNCPVDRRAIADSVASWDAFALEEAIQVRGGTAAAARTQQEWRAHPQGRLLAEQPVVRLQRIGDADPEPFPELPCEDPLPMSGLKVLDNTHIMAGPISARSCAALGADVLHIVPPRGLDPVPMLIQTGVGKRSAFCDLTAPADVKTFWNLLRDTDIFVNSYQGLDRRGFGPQALIERRPGLIYADVRCWGTTGPWGPRGGFDQNACAATGFAVEQGSFDGPALPPTVLLADFLAPALATPAIIEALRRRAEHGGSYYVQVNLARVYMWIQDMGLLGREQIAGLDPVTTDPDLPIPTPEVVSLARLVTHHGSFGETHHLPTPITYSAITPHWARGPEPLGASPLAW